MALSQREDSYFNEVKYKILDAIDEYRNKEKCVEKYYELEMSESEKNELREILEKYELKTEGKTSLIEHALSNVVINILTIIEHEPYVLALFTSHDHKKYIFGLIKVEKQRSIMTTSYNYDDCFRTFFSKDLLEDIMNHLNKSTDNNSAKQLMTEDIRKNLNTHKEPSDYSTL